MGVDDHALSDGFVMSSNALFQKDIHEINCLIELGIYVKESNSTTNLIAWQHSLAMENVNCVVAGQEPVDATGKEGSGSFVHAPPPVSQPDTPVFGAAAAPSEDLISSTKHKGSWQQVQVQACLLLPKQPCCRSKHHGADCGDEVH